jgi:hypothetical protein
MVNMHLRFQTAEIPAKPAVVPSRPSKRWFPEEKKGTVTSTLHFLIIKIEA